MSLSSESSEGPKCSICLDHIGNTRSYFGKPALELENSSEEGHQRMTVNKVIIVCSHLHFFHKDCLERWVNEHNVSCPMCRNSEETFDVVTFKTPLQEETSKISSRVLNVKRLSKKRAFDIFSNLVSDDDKRTFLQVYKQAHPRLRVTPQEEVNRRFLNKRSEFGRKFDTVMLGLIVRSILEKFGKILISLRFFFKNRDQINQIIETRVRKIDAIINQLNASDLIINQLNAPDLIINQLMDIRNLISRDSFDVDVMITALMDIAQQIQQIEDIPNQIRELAEGIRDRNDDVTNRIDKTFQKPCLRNAVRFLNIAMASFPLFILFRLQDFISSVLLEGRVLKESRDLKEYGIDRVLEGGEVTDETIEKMKMVSSLLKNRKKLTVFIKHKRYEASLTLSSCLAVVCEVAFFAFSIFSLIMFLNKKSSIFGYVSIASFIFTILFCATDIGLKIGYTAIRSKNFTLADLKQDKAKFFATFSSLFENF